MTFHPLPKPLRIATAAFAGVCVLAFATIGGASAFLLAVTHDRIHDDWPGPAQLSAPGSSRESRREADPSLAAERERAAEEIASELASPPDCIVVLGARVFDSTRPSLALARRLERSLELFDAGAAPRICITGDGRPGSDPEIDAMRSWLLRRGVPESALMVDAKGYTTFISMKNLREAGIGSAIVVTQDYHLPRAVFDAADQGIDAVGVEADRGKRHLRSRIREALARVKALWLTAAS